MNYKLHTYSDPIIHLYKPTTLSLEANIVTTVSAFDRQAASRNNSRSSYDKFVESSMTTIRECTLRGQLDVVETRTPVDISEVEPASEIVKRFCTGGTDAGAPDCGR